MADSREGTGPQVSGSQGGGRQRSRDKAAAARAAAAAAAERRRRLTIAAGAVGGVLVVLIVIIVIGVTSGGSSKKTPAAAPSAAPASAVRDVTSIPAATFDAVGVGTTAALPQKITDGTLLTQNGKPKIIYVGAEYCPFCAAARWPLVAALARFGTFSGLQGAESSPSDVHPSTKTFSFHGSTYTSDLLVFDPVETQTTNRQPLETPTAEQKSLVLKYDAPPYITADGAGSIPFLDIANKFVQIGASYEQDPALKGKSLEQIAAALADPSTPQSKAIAGGANVLSAVLCELTGNKPAAVCTSKGVTTARAALDAGH